MRRFLFILAVVASAFASGCESRQKPVITADPCGCHCHCNSCGCVTDSNDQPLSR
jgi:hypothetical protein